MAEEAARASYGRLVSILAARTGDIAGAEEALSDAFLAALTHWPGRGIPANPDAWLVTAARNARHNARRHAGVRAAALGEIERRLDEQREPGGHFPDERLKLLFVCAHPAIDPGARAPLMLQTVLGLDAARIAQAFLVSAPAMGQRLVRAKTRIRDARIRFAVPEQEDLAGRLGDVLDAVYAIYGCGWDALGEPDGLTDGLGAEALFLGRLIVSLLPGEPEAHGLLALMLYCEARKAARRDASGGFVPLRQQDARLWDAAMIIEAERHLQTAAGFQRFGRFQCEAAIQSVHVQRPITGHTNYGALATLYGMLLALAPSAGATVGYAAVLLETGDPQRSLTVLDGLSEQDASRYQPYWAVRAAALHAAGRPAEAAVARERALSLTSDAAVAAFLAR